MEKQGPNVWLVGLIILAAIYLTLFGLLGIAMLFSASLMNLLLTLVGFSVVCVVCTVYVAFKEKRPFTLVLSLTVAGAIFLILGAFIFVPYTTNKTYATESSLDYTQYLYSTQTDAPSPPLVDQNGTLVAVTLSPMSSTTYRCEDIIFPYNYSIFQIDLSASGAINFAMQERTYSYGYGPVFINDTYLFFVGSDLGKDWATQWWTPPYSDIRLMDFTFKNLENQTIQFYFRMTEFYHAESIDASSTYYRSIMDPSLAYIGLSMVCVAVAIGAYSYRNLRTSKKDNISTDSLKD